MKFVDEATISVSAGKGGPGCLSFRRERNLPRGGPDGADGGRGGSVYLRSADSLNTLADFRYTRKFKAQNGRPGEGSNRTGAGGDDITIDVPTGTVVRDADTGETIADMDAEGLNVMVARGGDGGYGNARFKSSTNRAPRRTTVGYPGDDRRLALEMRVLADVGLLGMPNAGKSTLLRAVSQARPRVADYPFTTLHPQLGVVGIEPGRSFVMADIPGLIAGAAQGAGLGFKFLRHVTRTRLLLHLVDVAPFDPGRDPVKDVRDIMNELEEFSDDLATRERWLVLNKTDCLDPDDADDICDLIASELEFGGPVYRIAAISGDGCRKLAADVMVRLEEIDNPEVDDFADEAVDA